MSQVNFYGFTKHIQKLMIIFIEMSNIVFAKQKHNFQITVHHRRHLRYLLQIYHYLSKLNRPFLLDSLEFFSAFLK